MHLPPDHALAAAVANAHAEAQKVTGGANANYIPYLASVPPDLLGVAIVTRNGAIFEAGDSRYEFAIESLSKVATLALVMEEIGPEAVRRKIGADPTGLPFNSIVALELHNGKPLSPLVNAGAITAASLVAGGGADDRWARILSMQSRLAGRQIALLDALNQSEQSTNFHNRAIAWLLYSAGICKGDPMVALDIYTRQCSTLITTVDLAAIGATLANAGANPLTGERVISAKNVPPILAEMTMEGLYTASGDFAYTIGLPAKSGVGGGIVAVAPGQMAVAAFSPPIDAAGNSVRGLAAVRFVARALELNLFADGRPDMLGA